MGQLYDWSCEVCGLEGQVSGGEDFGMSAMTTTIYCQTCGNLQDAFIGDPSSMDDERRRPPRCGRRKAHVVNIWNKEMLCPRCGKAHLKADLDNPALLWD